MALLFINGKLFLPGEIQLKEDVTVMKRCETSWLTSMKIIFTNYQYLLKNGVDISTCKQLKKICSVSMDELVSIFPDVHNC